MGFSLETTNYKLGQYAGTDKPNYTTDYNENMAKIDAALKAVSDAGSAANTDLGDTKDRVSALETNVAKNTEDITSVTAAAAQNTRDIVSANSEIEALQTKDTEFEGDLENVKNQLETIPIFGTGLTNTKHMYLKSVTYQFSGSLYMEGRSVHTIQTSLNFNLAMSNYEGATLIGGFLSSIVDNNTSGLTASNTKIVSCSFSPTSPNNSSLFELTIAYTGESPVTITSFNANLLMLMVTQTIK